ncbi:MULTISPECIES: phosphoglucosamine mutase [Thiorhodovibrio]|uniref:phosphoglucosamine mutase n=1 Tax=Thiorhodovibrio TaxID=61593 RepID=UPI0019141C22|nr:MULTISPECIES: phosphoglucosamine mutase [Thiorhodovibrio]MBK5967459.1 phosphoglucosamine mutase [Thiorhodovibrio winogradskyi]WPL12585.1 Phosphoglucosamine mutase [Thiorhodovibrio litoralis]
MRKYFGTDGIRGRVGDPSVSPDFVLKLGWAAGRVLARHGSGRKVLIGKDTRISGYMFESALEAGLVAAGLDIRLLGPMPTPGVAYLTRTLRAVAGIVITASHNPYEDNGIKFFSGAGDKLPDETELAIEDELELPLEAVPASALGKAKRVEDASGRYIEFCKSTVPAWFSLKGLRIVVDCAHGATYNIAPYVFDELGADIIPLGVEPDGFNINKSVGSLHLEAVQQAVAREQADLGIAFDGDGDRVLMVDGDGRLIDGDVLLYLIAKSRREMGCLSGPVVGTLMSNLALEQALQGIGIDFVRVKVGDRYVMERLKADEGVLGGEPSGHIICRDRTSTGDGIVAALQVLAALAGWKQSLAEAATAVVHYPQVLINLRLEQQRDVINLPGVQRAVRAAEERLGDHGRVLLRPSGTEPVVRVMVEGRDRDQVEQMAAELAESVRAQAAA